MVTSPASLDGKDYVKFPIFTYFGGVDSLSRSVFTGLVPVVSSVHEPDLRTGDDVTCMHLPVSPFQFASVSVFLASSLMWMSNVFSHVNQ